MIDPLTFVIPIHYTPAVPVVNWLAIQDEAETIAKFIDGKNYGPHASGILALHASQVNKRPFNYFVLNPEPFGPKLIEELGSRFILNPQIEPFHPDLLVEMKEGCVSFPYRKQKLIKRAVICNVSYDIPDNKSSNGLKPMKKQVKQIIAQIFQHEVMHSEGRNIHFTGPKN